MTDNELRTWRQQVINDAATAAHAYVDQQIAELRSFFLNDNEDSPGLLVRLLAEIDRRTREQTDDKIKQIPAGPVGPEGHLPAVKPYVPDTVYYRGDCVSYAGGCYEAVRDTARPPPHADDWICLAAAGRDGQDGLGFRVCGLFRADQCYSRNDVCVFNKAAWVAKYDSPGTLPGDGWYLLVGQGRTGDKGPPGPRGQPGPAGETVTIIDWELDPERYLATPLLSDGSKARPLSLQPFFERYHGEVA